MAVAVAAASLLALGGVHMSAAAGTATASVTVPTEPYRILDTRNGIGTGGRLDPLGPGSTLTLQVAGVGPVPADATGVVINLTVSNGTASGSYITAWPTGSARPDTSVINVVAGQDTANMVTATLGDGRLDLYNFSGTVHLIADVAGYLVPAGSPGGTGTAGSQGPPGPPGPQGIVDFWTITGVPTEPGAGGYVWAFNRPPVTITVGADQAVFGTASTSVRQIVSGQWGMYYAICSRPSGQSALTTWGSQFSWYGLASQNNSVTTNAMLTLDPGTYDVGPCSAVEQTGKLNYNSDGSTTLMLLNT